MISKQVIWRELTDEEKAERTLQNKGKFAFTKMITGDNKSRPGRNIRANNEEDTFVYSSDNS